MRTVCRYLRSTHLKSFSSLLEIVPLPPPGGPRIMVFVDMLRRDEETNCDLINDRNMFISIFRGKSEVRGGILRKTIAGGMN